MKQRGFTVIELLVFFVILIVGGILFWTYKNDVESLSRDDKRRTAINAMHYSLEDAFYAKNKYYPQSINETNLTTMDKSHFTDPNGNVLGTSESNYRYEPTGCEKEKCTGYTLRADLEREGDYIKENRERD